VKYIKEILNGKIEKEISATFFSALQAGVFIGFGCIYSAVAATYGSGRIVSGLVFSLGLMLVVLFKVDLFTGNILLFLVDTTRKKILKNWLITYFGNFTGSLLLVYLIYLCYLNDNELINYFISLTKIKLSYTFQQAFALGILCNILVCLSVWLSFSAQSILEKMLVCLLPVGLFVSAGFEHSIANMFILLIGIIYSDFSIINFFENLLPVSIGNIIGGLIVSLFVKSRI
jgi:formate transporter